VHLEVAVIDRHGTFRGHYTVLKVLDDHNGGKDGDDTIVVLIGGKSEEKRPLQGSGV
jgi:hypothetical protein